MHMERMIHTHPGSSSRQTFHPSSYRQPDFQRDSRAAACLDSSFPNLSAARHPLAASRMQPCLGWWNPAVQSRHHRTLCHCHCHLQYSQLALVVIHFRLSSEAQRSNSRSDNAEAMPSHSLKAWRYRWAMTDLPCLVPSGLHQTRERSSPRSPTLEAWSQRKNSNYQ